VHDCLKEKNLPNIFQIRAARISRFLSCSNNRVESRWGLFRRRCSDGTSVAGEYSGCAARTQSDRAIKGKITKKLQR